VHDAEASNPSARVAAVVKQPQPSWDPQATFKVCINNLFCFFDNLFLPALFKTGSIFGQHRLVSGRINHNSPTPPHRTRVEAIALVNEDLRRRRSCLSRQVQLAFAHNAHVHLARMPDMVVELSITLGQQRGYEIRPVRRIDATRRMIVHRLSDPERHKAMWAKVGAWPIN